MRISQSTPYEYPRQRYAAVCAQAALLDRRASRPRGGRVLALSRTAIHGSCFEHFSDIL